MTAANTDTADEILKLVDIMATLRSPGGCPWDQKQTPETLKPYVLEETYELLEAIDSDNSADIRDELGDLLLQVVFIAQIFQELNKFGLADVAESIGSKLIRRHPHVFADADVHEHAQRWEEIKQQERSEQGKGDSLMERIPKNLPGLKQATKIAKKMDPTSKSSQMVDMQLHFSNLSRVIAEPGTTQQQFENILGDILFGTTQLAISLGIDAEDLLRKKNLQVMTGFDI